MNYNARLAEIMLAISDGKIVDQNAFTVEELCERSGARSDFPVRQQARKLCKEGKWEQVWKKAGRRLVFAYRVKAPKTRRNLSA